MTGASGLPVREGDTGMRCCAKRIGSDRANAKVIQIALDVLERSGAGFSRVRSPAFRFRSARRVPQRSGSLAGPSRS